MKTKRFTLMLLVMLMSMTGAWAQTFYVDADGEVKRVHGAVEITPTSSPLSAGWYVVTNADVQTNSIKCHGDVHIIIADGAKLTVTSSTKQEAGINVTGSLTIYGQSNQTGQLIVFGGEKAAGIGGNYAKSGSNITINGGVVTANGGKGGAGIGGGDGGVGSHITINGGVITANGGSDGAGIGGGHGGDGTNITINGGIVTANSGDTASGIGGGSLGTGSYITINGGTVTANGGYYSAGIGGGYYGSGSYITINGGIVTATSDHGSSIGSGIFGSCSNIFVTPTLRVRADNNNPPVNVIAHSSITEDISSSLNGKSFARITDLPFFYICSSDESKGVVFGSANDEYAPNTTLRFCAVPADGYKFKGWSDGNTDNPRQHTLTDDTSITANFEAVNEFEDPTGTGMRLRVKKTDGKTYEFSTSELEKVDYYRSTNVSE